MTNLLRMGTVAVAVLLCTGCGGPAPAEIDAAAESAKLESSADYQKQMQGQMGGKK